jgi:hypothetical protein
MASTASRYFKTVRCLIHSPQFDIKTYAYNTISGQISVVGESVQTRARAPLIASLGRLELMNPIN